MFPIVFAGLIGAAAAIAGAFGAQQFTAKAPAADVAVKNTLQIRKAGGLNVPVLRSGSLQGYIVAQLAYTVDPGVADLPAAAIDGLLLDEAFRTLYTDEKLNVGKLEQYDLNGLTRQLQARVRSRVNSDAFKDVLIQEFSFVPSNVFK